MRLIVKNSESVRMKQTILLLRFFYQQIHLERMYLSILIV